MKPRKKHDPAAPRIVKVSNAYAIGVVDGDRVYIRKTLVAMLQVPSTSWGQGYIETGEHLSVEIISIKPGYYAVTPRGQIVHNVGINWEIHYHVRSYKDARKTT